MKIILLTLLILFGCCMNYVQPLDCSIYGSEKQIIESLPVPITINPQGSTPIGSYAVVISLGRVIELTLTMAPFIPSSIYCLTNLQTLTIQYGTNMTISPDIARLASTLKTLNLIRISSNLVLPNEFFTLINLRKLSIVSCGLETLPDAIGQINRLNQLDLTNNLLKSLPSSLGNLSQLVQLVVDNNPGLTSLKTLSVSRYLQTFSAANCSIEDLPTNQYSFGTINLSNNKLKSLENLANIIADSTGSIDFSNNQITILPSEIGLALSLSQLNLSNNALTELPEDIYALQLLLSLNVRNNSFSLAEKRWIQGRFAPTKTNVDI